MHFRIFLAVLSAATLQVIAGQFDGLDISSNKIELKKNSVRGRFDRFFERFSKGHEETGILNPEKQDEVLDSGEREGLHEYEAHLYEYIQLIRFGRGELKKSDDGSTRIKRSSVFPSEDGVFSFWGSWLKCNAAGCGNTGIQMRMRTCYVSNTEDRSSCRYANLVNFRSCEGPPCTTAATGTGDVTSEYRWSEWTPWNKCSNTCGGPGKQRRTRICLKYTGDKAEATLSRNCIGRARQNRQCRYSLSCPKWDTWSSWGACSVTCDNGEKMRRRECIVERYMKSLDKNGGDLKIGEFPILNESGEEVYVVEATTGSEGVVSNKIKEVIDVGNGILVKEIIEEKRCEEQSLETSEEKKTCATDVICKSVWDVWQSWSPCSKTCGAGISKRARQCILNVKSDPCEGRMSNFRRCYRSACWGQWVEGQCSETCGAGVMRRKRKCLKGVGVLSTLNNCVGKSAESVECHVKKCPGDNWGPWGPWSECTTSCNDGFKHRNRTCHGDSCVGDENELMRCNLGECPFWGRWGAFTCCSVTCGNGLRKRERTCKNSTSVLDDSTCEGRASDEEECYLPPCLGSSRSPEFPLSECGQRPKSNLKNTAQLRIFGGNRASAHSWPWQTSWQKRFSLDTPWKHYCGGTLIHQRWVVLAGHCMQETIYYINLQDPGPLWSMVLGMHRLYEDGDRYFVERVFLHPAYAHVTVTLNDIALVKLRKMVTFTQKVSPICMPEMTTEHPGELCTITGWGRTSRDGNHSKFLREAQIPIMNFTDCRSLGDYYRYFLDSSIHMCAGNPILAESDSCTGDSGGPLVCEKNRRWYLSGITSFAFAHCGTPGHAGVYAPLVSYEKWIEETIKEHTYEKC